MQLHELLEKWRQISNLTFGTLRPPRGHFLAPLLFGKKLLKLSAAPTLGITCILALLAGRVQECCWVALLLHCGSCDF